MTVSSMNSYLALSLACLLTVQALPTKENNFEVSISSNRVFCCGEVTTKCAQGCAGKSCDIQCSGTCRFLNSQCGPYTCSSVTNACVSSSDTTAATTTTTTTTESCLGSGTLCLSMTEGKVADCCSGSADCNVFVSGVGYNCA